jgi:hypothetical protein
MLMTSSCAGCWLRTGNGPCGIGRVAHADTPIKARHAAWRRAIGMRAS